MLPRLSILALLSLRTLSDVITGIPDAAPPSFEQWESPIVLPAPSVQGTADWASAVQRARAFLAGLTLEEKVNITTGVDVLGRYNSPHLLERAEAAYVYETRGSAWRRDMSRVGEGAGEGGGDDGEMDDGSAGGEHSSSSQSRASSSHPSQADDSMISSPSKEISREHDFTGAEAEADWPEWGAPA
ncbi:hypothetical protein B0H11DRAFT_2229019 [Mycena galericulata]|nr:hypothetical protein B0H11DRAFT_2237791 [Mycena galericulata]KAJ7491497.1 hypothetical protein B0H11DRAFT_2229019 [Mycena galericulata]